MKYFAIVLLFGLASASLLEIYPDSDEQDFLLKSDKQKSKEDPKTELGRHLREALHRLLERIKQAVEEGKHVSEELINQAKDLIKRLKGYGLKVTDEIKDMLHYWKERYSKWREELLDLIRGDNSTVHSAEPKLETELAKKLREEFKRVVKRIKEAIEQGKHVSQKLWDEAKDLARRLREYGVNIVDEVRDMLEFVEERYHKRLQELLDILHRKNSTL